MFSFLHIFNHHGGLISAWEFPTIFCGSYLELKLCLAFYVIWETGATQVPVDYDTFQILTISSGEIPLATCSIRIINRSS